MARRIWIIPKDTDITQEVRDEAIANNCPEIVQGMPPILEGKIEEASLPIAFEEPEHPAPEPSRDLLTEIDVLKVRVKDLEIKSEELR